MPLPMTAPASLMSCPWLSAVLPLVLMTPSSVITPAAFQRTARSPWATPLTLYLVTRPVDAPFSFIA